MSLPQDRDSVYDRIRPHLDASDLIARLGLQQSRISGSEAFLRPLCHESVSGESLHVNLHTGRWLCRACSAGDVYGDLIQLVEYALSGGAAPTHGRGQMESTGHRAALEWLCGQYGVPYDSQRINADAALEVVHMFSMEAHLHLRSQPKVLEWIFEKWGFDSETVEAYGIGYMPSPILPSIAAESRRPEARDAFRSSGLGWYADGHEWQTRFAGRVTFPYLEHGRAVYLIGRATPWTPALNDQRTPPKYHKLSVHSDQRPHISERINNDHLYNETVMRTVDELGIVEGIADAVAVSSLGVPVISPVTISFNAVDQERFLRKCHENGIGRVWILFDNELSGSGNAAAIRTGRKLIEGGLSVRVLTLPLGEEQQRARDEVIGALGQERFDELEQADPMRRKEIVTETITDEQRREWALRNIALSKIDAAEWAAQQGAGAAGRFDAMLKAGEDVVEIMVREAAKRIDPDEENIHARIAPFAEIIKLAAHVDDRLMRQQYAGMIGNAAGRGITKADIAQQIAQHRRQVVAPERKTSEQETRREEAEDPATMIVLPPEMPHAQPPAPPVSAASPKVDVAPNAPAAPPLPEAKQESAHDRYEYSRKAVLRAVEAKLSEEHVGRYVAQTILVSMGWTSFRTSENTYIVRGNRRVTLDTSPRSEFRDLLFIASALSCSKATHRSYIDVAMHFIRHEARRVRDVSWSYVEGGAVFFPLGNLGGSILRIEPGSLTRTRMAEVKVPAVAGEEFEPISYVEGDGGIEKLIEKLRWIAISDSDRLMLVYWIVCLPILRLIGQVPIVRIEGGSSSGKTRAIESVSYLVNGRIGSSVPSAAALLSRLSTNMLTIDDNRESGDITRTFLGTLLQATHLGAREKRKANTDTGTVVERVSGALLMNGVEPIHSGRSELASRMLVLRATSDLWATDSPSDEAPLARAVLELRDGFWSEAARRCSSALELDETHGEALSAKVSELFGATRIGRLSKYLRTMYLAWVAGRPESARAGLCAEMAPEWQAAFANAAQGSLESLTAEELSVTAIRYVMAFGYLTAEPVLGGNERVGLEGKYVDRKDGTGMVVLGFCRATQLARLARRAGKELNAPGEVSYGLRAGQLERRLVDGQDFLRAAGYEVEILETNKGRLRFRFTHEGPVVPERQPQGGDTWTGE